MDGKPNGSRRRILYTLAAAALAAFWFGADYEVDRADQWCLRCGRLRLAEIKRIGSWLVLSQTEQSDRATAWSALHDRLDGPCAPHVWKSFHGRIDGPSRHANYSGYRPPQLNWDASDLDYLAGSMPVLLKDVVGTVDRIAGALPLVAMPSPEAREKFDRIDGMFRACLGARLPTPWQIAWDEARKGL